MAKDAEVFRYFEFAEEDTPGVAETTPEMSCDAKSLSPGIPDKPEMEAEGSMGQGRTVHRPGFYSTSPKGEFGVDLKVIARMMKFALGGLINVVTEGDGSGIDPDSVLLYDKSGNSYSSKKTAFKDVTANDITIPGHASAEIDDFLAIGSSDQFSIINVVVGTAKTDVSTIIWEYWDGSTWKALTVTDTTTGFTVSGAGTITFTPPVDWQKTGLNSSGDLYFVRARCSVFTSAGEAGALTSGSISTLPDLSTQYIWAQSRIKPPTFTGWFGIDLDAFVIPGLVINKLELAVENEFITIKPEMVGMQETLGNLKTEDELNKNDDYPLAWYECNIHMRPYKSTVPWGEATLISPDVKKLNLPISRGAKAEDGQGLGSRFPYRILWGKREIGFSFDYNYLTKKWYNLMQGGENGPQEKQGATEFEMMMEFDAGKYGSAQFYFPRVIVNGAPVESKGRDPIVQSISIDAYQDSVSIPTIPEPTVVYTELLCTFVHKFPDITAGADMPAWAQATP